MLFRSYSAPQYLASINRPDLKDQNPKISQFGVKWSFTPNKIFYSNNECAFASDGMENGYCGMFDTASNKFQFSQDGFRSIATTATTDTAGYENIWYVHGYWITITKKCTLYYKQNVGDPWQSVNLASAFSTAYEFRKILFIYWNQEEFPSKYTIIAITNNNTNQVVCINLLANFTNPSLVYETSIGSTPSEITYSKCIQVLRYSKSHNGAVCVGYNNGIATNIKTFGPFTASYRGNYNALNDPNLISNSKFYPTMIPCLIDRYDLDSALVPCYNNRELCLIDVSNYKLLHLNISITTSTYVRIFPFTKDGILANEGINNDIFLMLVGDSNGAALYYTSNISSNNWIEIELAPIFSSAETDSSRNLTPTLVQLPNVWWDNEGVCFTVTAKANSTQSYEAYIKLYYLTTPPLNLAFNANLFWVKVKD